MTLSQPQLLSEAQKRQVLEIWNSEFPSVIGFKTLEGLEEYLKKLTQPVHYVFSDEADDEKPLIGWLSTFDRDGGRWFVMLVRSDWQGKRIGTRLVKAMQLAEREVNGWISAKSCYSKNNGLAYTAPELFYKKLGFQITSIEHDNGIISTRKIVWNKPRK